MGLATGTDEPLTPIGNRRLGAVSARHFGRIKLNLMAAIPAPHDEAKMGSRRVPERHRRAGVGFHLLSSPIPPLARRLVMSEWSRRFAFRLGAKFVENLSQSPNAGRGPRVISVGCCRSAETRENEDFCGVVGRAGPTNPRKGGWSPLGNQLRDNILKSG